MKTVMLKVKQHSAHNLHNPQTDWKRIFQLFLPMLWVHKKALALAYGWGFITIVAIVLTPWPLKYSIDYVLAGKPLPEWLQQGLPHTSSSTLIVILAIITVLIAVLGAIASAEEKLRNARIREQLGREVRDRVLRHIQSLPAQQFDQHKSGELVLRLADDGQKVVRLLTKTTPVIFRHLGTTLLALGAMLLVSPYLGLLGGSIVMGLGLLIRKYAQPLRSASRYKRKAEGSVSALAQEIIKGLANTQAQGMEAQVSHRFQQKTVISQQAGVEETRIAITMERTMQLANGMAMALVIGGGGYLVLQQQLTLGSLTVCLAYMMQLLKPVEKINDLASSVSRALVRGENLLHLLDQTSPLKAPANALQLDNPKGYIKLQQVSYRYPHPTMESKPEAVLQNISLQLQPGKLTVLVGASGSGKSTLLHLILRMMDAETGRLSFDGIPYQRIQLQSLRQQFAVMLQRTHVFSGTLREHFDLPVSDSPANETKIWQMLRLVSLTDFVNKLPQGLDSPLGEDAVNLSGGQRARLALARTLLMDRPVLLLDEPLANVDPESREIILNALDQVRKKRSCLVITHQMELTKRADNVFFLQGGRLKPMVMAAKPPSMRLVK
jgi:ABC-type multidrug transport system fused ATPase/permease subunit